MFQFSKIEKICMLWFICFFFQDFFYIIFGRDSVTLGLYFFPSFGDICDQKIIAILRIALILQFQ